MPELTEKIVTLLDESFRPEEPVRYSLMMEIGSRRLSWCLLDVEMNKFIGVGSVPESYIKAIGSLPWITHPFHSRRIIFSNGRTTLIPATLFLEEEKENYLTFNLEKEKDDIVLFDRMESLGIINVYAMPEQVNSDLSRIFPGSKQCHVSSVLIGCLYVNYKNIMGSGRMFLNVRDEEFDLVIFSGKQLKYANSFPFRVPEDIAYYLIFVMEQMNLNPEEIPLMLLGTTDNKSRIYEMLFRYVRTVEFARRNETYAYSYVMDDLPGNWYYTLFNSGQCGL
jgi:hypothetical protein